MITSKLRVITGLHIGGSDDTMKIGGIDSSVVKRVVFSNDDGSIDYEGTGKKVTEPYIPGSSLKGKIRSLLEHSFGLIREQKLILGDKAGNPVDTAFANKIKDEALKKKANLIILLFGETAGREDTTNTKITRTIFRDTFLTKESRKLYLEDKIELSEEKGENTINRVSVEANPRFMERVPAGVAFDFEVVLRDFTEDADLPLEKTLELGLKLLENDALGGGGSRGNGKIEFDIYQKEDRNITNEIQRLMKEIEASL